jgi:hypothetical protein
MIETIDGKDMYDSFELFHKFLDNRKSLTPLEIIKLKQAGIKFW